MKQIKIGMISFAHTHAYSYAEFVRKHDQAHLVGVYDEDSIRSAAAAEKFQITSFETLVQLLDAVDAVIICSDNLSYYAYAKEAASKGVHILVEKPITTNGKETRQLINLCRELNVCLMTAFPVRLNASVQAAKEQIDRGDIGEIIAIAATNQGKMPGDWFIDPKCSGGGSVLDHTVHVADIIRWLMGAEAVEVYAEAGTLLHEFPVDDCGLLSIRYSNGVFATLDSSWSRPASYPRSGSVSLRIVGTKGALHVETNTHGGHMWRDKAEFAHSYLGLSEVDHASLVSEFIDCLACGRQPLITGEDGLRAAELAWAACESTIAGQPVSVKYF